MVLTQLLQIADVLLLGSMTAAAAEKVPLSEKVPLYRR